MRVWRFLLFLSWVLISAIGRPAAAGALEDPAHAGHALAEYVQRPDPAFGWTLRREESNAFVKVWFLELQSQQWLDETRVDRTLWQHELRIIRPRTLACLRQQAPHTALLLIAGGKNKDRFSHTMRPEFPLVAATFCRTVVEVRQVPNQPLRFTGETRGRREDALLARSFERFLAGDDADWPVHPAMVKAAVRAMDAAQAFARRQRDIPDIDRFVLMGTSKRGWAAWLTAAVDPRVQAVIPVSIDMPDLARQLPHHLAAYGDYAPALRDYKALELRCLLQGPRAGALLDIVDPVRHLDRLHMPKLVLNSAGDEFFVSDASRFYFAALPGEKRLRYTANTDHGQNGADRTQLLQQVRNWVDDVVTGRTPPALAWQEDNGTLLVTPSTPARKVLLWTAHNPAARDFRLETQGAIWHSRELHADADGRYRAPLATPDTGWQAAFVEAHFGGWRASTRQVYTTDVYVRPESMPYPVRDCAPQTQDAFRAPPDRAPDPP